MVRAKFGLEYLHRPTVERLGLVVLALVLEQFGEVIVVSCNVGMILAENLFVDLHGPTKERLGLVILALVLEQTGEVIVVSCNVGMILAENPFVDLDGPTIERLGLHVAREVMVRKRQVVQRRGSLSGIWAKCRGHKTQCRFFEGGGSGVVAHHLCQSSGTLGILPVVWLQPRGAGIVSTSRAPVDPLLGQLTGLEDRARLDHIGLRLNL